MLDFSIPCAILKLQTITIHLHKTKTMNITIKRDKAGNEFPVSIRSGWPDLLKKEFRGKLRGSRSKLLGNRENECRVTILPAKRVSNKIGKMREEIATNRAKRNRLVFIARNPTVKAGPISPTGTIQPRQSGKFLPKVKVSVTC